MLSLLLAQKILQLLIIMGFGFAAVRLKLLKSEDSMVLSKICLYVIVPCMILNIFQVDLSPEILSGFKAAYIGVALLHMAAILVGMFFRKVFHADVVEEMSVVYPNAGNLIVPLISYVLGEEWLLYSTAYMTFQTVFFWTHCVHAFSGEKKFHLKKILLNVNIISIFVGIIMMITGLRLPSILDGVTGSVGDMLGPVSMLVSGMLAANLKLKEVLKRKRIFLVFAFKMIVAAFVALFILKGVGYLAGSAATVDLDRVLLVPFLAAIAPSASTIVQFSQVYHKDAQYASSINILTLIGCIITMPLFVYLYELF
ncbi:MAG: AEC family transporter [Lachnospiraceae bacterium]|nr:AEC family transporter [Lachnospiraceae bacterium]